MLKMYVKLLRAICFMAVLTAFAIGLLIVVDAFVPRSKPVSYVFHVCEFIAGLLLTMLAQRVLVKRFSSRHEKSDGNMCARQFGCRFAAVVLAVSLTSAAALILCVIISRDVKMQIPVPNLSASHKEVRVVPVARKSVAVDRKGEAVATFPSVFVICGDDANTAARYDLRNDALRSIARRRDLSADDVAALMEYVASTKCTMRVEREAALKNDVLNLLRNQKQQPEGLADLLLDMVASGQYAPVIIDYCIQHLGAMVGLVSDDLMKARIREVFVAAAKDIGETYSGTALYSLAEMPCKSKKEADELRRLTVAACGEGANPIARISAIQLAGERGYRETLPILRSILAGIRRDAVLDMAAVGSIGLMGNANDIQLLESFRSRGGRRMKTAIDTAVQRINNRCSVKDAKR